MQWPALIWVVGGVVLLMAGFGAALLPRLQERRRQRNAAWSSARAAIAGASISRDAALRPVAEAEHLLIRAELLAARRGGPAAARRAAECARQADQLWREAADG